LAGPDEKTIVYFHVTPAILGIINRVRGYADAGYGVLRSPTGLCGNSGDPTEDGLYADGRARIAWLVTGIRKPRLLR
jgi:hypothetical protein